MISPRTDYEQLLSEFGADRRPSPEAVAYLESKGYSNSQARNAVYRFKQRRGLQRKR